MSVELLELAAAALGELLDEVVFVGGATVGLWITDPAAPAPRPTKDVDVIVEVSISWAIPRVRGATSASRIPRRRGQRRDLPLAPR